jgi:hypothetical protein
MKSRRETPSISRVATQALPFQLVYTPLRPPLEHSYFTGKNTGDRKQFPQFQTRPQHYIRTLRVELEQSFPRLGFSSLLNYCLFQQQQLQKKNLTILNFRWGTSARGTVTELVTVCAYETGTKAAANGPYSWSTKIVVALPDFLSAQRYYRFRSQRYHRENEGFLNLPGPYSSFSVASRFNIPVLLRCRWSFRCCWKDAEQENSRRVLEPGPTS